MDGRRKMIDSNNEKLSLRKQCDLLAVNRSSFYYKKSESEINDVTLLNEIRDLWIKRPYFGYRRMTQELKLIGHAVNHKKVYRLMALSDMKVWYPKAHKNSGNHSSLRYPYLLKNLPIVRSNQVWQIDITYLKMRQGFMYLASIIDVYSRYVVGWSLSNTLDASNCLEALSSALTISRPEIINSDQGSQFTGEDWLREIGKLGCQISMTGKGRCLDNVYIERFWRSFKQEEFYLNEYQNVRDLKRAISDYIDFYNHKRCHQSLGYKRPAELYFGGTNVVRAVDMMDNVLVAHIPTASTTATIF